MHARFTVKIVEWLLKYKDVSVYMIILCLNWARIRVSAHVAGVKLQQQPQYLPALYISRNDITSWQNNTRPPVADPVSRMAESASRTAQAWTLQAHLGSEQLVVPTAQVPSACFADEQSAPSVRVHEPGVAVTGEGPMRQVMLRHVLVDLHPHSNSALL